MRMVETFKTLKTKKAFSSMSRNFHSVQVSATSYKYLRTKSKKGSIEVFAASMADINKALRPKVRTDPRDKLPIKYHEFLDVFDYKEAEKLPPLRGREADHAIELETKEGKEADG